MNRVWGFAAVASLLFVSTSHAELVSLAATRDATLYEAFDGSLANGAGRYLFAGKNNQNRARRGLIHFDLSGVLPQGSTITAARLVLNLSQGTGGPAREVSVHRALSSWTVGASDPDDPEGSGTSALAGDATWLFSSADGLGGGTSWQSAGGDFDATASASTMTSAVGLYTWSSSQLLADVTTFAANPGSNLGWFLVGDESTFGTARRFDSADSATLGGIAPRLEIEFTAVPAPAAPALAPIAALIAFRRRRR